jgi:hypothetical protein
MLVRKIQFTHQLSIIVAIDIVILKPLLFRSFL